jgi:hypothetical protein
MNDYNSRFEKTLFVVSSSIIIVPYLLNISEKVIPIAKEYFKISINNGF